MSPELPCRDEAMRIAGEKVGAGRGGERTIQVFDPYGGKRVGSVPKATVDEVRRAIAIARGHRPTLSRYERASILDHPVALAQLAGDVKAPTPGAGEPQVTSTPFALKHITVTQNSDPS